MLLAVDVPSSLNCSTTSANDDGMLTRCTPNGTDIILMLPGILECRLHFTIRPVVELIRVPSAASISILLLRRKSIPRSGTGISATMNFHWMLKRKPKLIGIVRVPKVLMGLLFAADSAMLVSGCMRSANDGGTVLTDAPVSIRKVCLEVGS